MSNEMLEDIEPKSHNLKIMLESVMVRMNFQALHRIDWNQFVEIEQKGESFVYIFGISSGF